LPIARFQVKRQNERYLRYDLWICAMPLTITGRGDRNAFQTKVDSQGYPPDWRRWLTAWSSERR